MIELANRFQLGPQSSEISHPPLDPPLVIGGNRELARPSSGIAHREDPNPVAFSPAALQATPAMEDPAIQQRTSHDLGQIGQFAEELLSRLANLAFVHQY